MKVMVAGGGAFGREHLAALSRIGGVTLALAELREDGRTAAMQDFTLADSDADALALMERFRPDGVIIATPVAAHEDLALAALGQDIAVLVEKPVVADVPAMERLCAAEDRSRAFLQPGHILRFSAPHIALRTVLHSGEIGSLLAFSSRRYRDAGHAARYADVDPVLMTMIHDIDLALWFDASGAETVVATRHHIAGGGSLTCARIGAAGGAVWDLRTAWLHPGPDLPPDRVEIVGTEGSAEWEAGRGITVYGAAPRHIAEMPDDPLGAELNCFLARIAGRPVDVPVTSADALAGLRLAGMVTEALAAP